MNPMPLLLREFQVALRRPLTFRLRLAFGGGSMLLAIWSILVSAVNSGAQIFQVLIWIGAVLSMAVAVFGASDSLSRERREGTLGFLFLTDLRAADVILGKLSAAGLIPLYTLIAMFPAFAICVLVGGVPALLFWKGMTALIITLILSGCATLYVSSLCEDHRKAFGGAAFLLLIANPLWLCWTALKASNTAFFWSALLFLGLAVLFFYGAAGRVQRNWRDPERGFISKETAKEKALRVATRSRLLERIPVAWMMLRRRDRRRWLKWILWGACGMLVATIAANPPRVGFLKLGLWPLFAFHVAYQIVLLTRTAYAFYLDQRSGALELLLGSRLSNEEIFAGFNSFLLRKSVPAILCLALADMAYAGLLWMGGAGPIAALPLAMAAVQFITLAGVGWLGVYRALMMNHPSLAMLATYARLSLIPVVLSLLFLSVPRTDFIKVAAFYLMSSGFLAVFFSMDAKTALAEHGRTLLLRPATETPPHIESEWSFIDWEESGAPETRPRPRQAA